MKRENANVKIFYETEELGMVVKIIKKKNSITNKMKPY